MLFRSRGPRLLGVEPPGPRQGQRVAAAGHPVFQWEMCIRDRIVRAVGFVHQQRHAARMAKPGDGCKVALHALVGGAGEDLSLIHI